ALVGALLVHASVFVEIGRSVPRTIGDRSGLEDAISVDLVTEADLRSRETVAMPPAGKPAPPPLPEAQPLRQNDPEPPAPPPDPQPEPEAAQPAPKEPAPPEPAQEQAALPDFESVLKDLATTPVPTEQPKAKPAPAKAAETPQETKQKAEELA